LKKKKIFEGKILGLSVHSLTIQGRKVTREIIEHRGAAAMLAIDKDNKVILVKQHRYPRGNVLEIPAGTLEKGENPKKCAFRELQEETGYKARKMTPLIKYCYVASDLSQPGDLELDEDEIISVVKIPLKKLIKMILAGKIIDSKTICAVLTYAGKKKLL
jgi:ADP-ribose pyrophosphatase